MARTDGDTWDPATGVGMTATFGATARAVAASKGLFNDPYAEALVRAAGVDYFIQVIDGVPEKADGRANPLSKGLMDILVMHARFLDGFLAEAGRVGIRQAVILASGLDTRAYRLWWPAGTTVYELDQPDILDFKTDVLRRLGGRLTANRRGVGIDLRGDWLAALRRVGFDEAAPTVWIAENLLVGYLPPDAQNRLLHDVTEGSAVGSRFAADHMPTWTPTQLAAGRAFVDGWRQYGLGVDLATLTYPGEYDDVPEYLTAQGWQTVDRNIVELLAVLGVEVGRPVRERDLAITPRYVTATRV